MRILSIVCILSAVQSYNQEILKKHIHEKLAKQTLDPIVANHMEAPFSINGSANVSGRSNTSMNSCTYLTPVKTVLDKYISSKLNDNVYDDILSAIDVPKLSDNLYEVADLMVFAFYRVLQFTPIFPLNITCKEESFFQRNQTYNDPKNTKIDAAFLRNIKSACLFFLVFTRSIHPVS